MSKYGEPWFYSIGDDDEGNESAKFYTKNNNPIFSTADMLLFCGDDTNAAERIIACINACDGIEDPEKEIADLQAQNASLLRLLADIRSAAGDPNGRLMQDELVEHIAELVRIFNAGTHLYYELGCEAESKEVAKALHCKQETIRRLLGLWPKQDPEINPGDPSDATGGVV